MTENIIVALIAITPTLLTIIITLIKDRKKVSLSTVKKDLGDSIDNLKSTMETNNKEIKSIMETNDKEIKSMIETNNMESLKRYLVFMLSRAKFDENFSFNEFEKTIVEDSYKIYRGEHGNGYVKELYHDCKRMGKL